MPPKRKAWWRRSEARALRIPSARLQLQRRHRRRTHDAGLRGRRERPLGAPEAAPRRHLPDRAGRGERRGCPARARGAERAAFLAGLDPPDPRHRPRHRDAPARHPARRRHPAGGVARRTQRTGRACAPQERDRARARPRERGRHAGGRALALRALLGALRQHGARRRGGRCARPGAAAPRRLPREPGAHAQPRHLDHALPDDDDGLRGARGGRAGHGGAAADHAAAREPRHAAALVHAGHHLGLALPAHLVVGAAGAGRPRHARRPHAGAHRAGTRGLRRA